MAATSVGRAHEMGAQQCFGFGDPVIAQRVRRGQQTRIARRMPDMAGIGLRGGIGVVQGREQVGQRQPSAGKVGLEGECVAHRDHRFGAASRAGQRAAMLQVRHRPARLSRNQRGKQFQRLGMPTERVVRCREHEQRRAVSGNHVEDLAGLLGGEQRAGREQSPGMREREVQRSGLRGLAHCGAVRNAVAAPTSPGAVDGPHCVRWMPMEEIGSVPGAVGFGNLRRAGFDASSRRHAVAGMRSVTST